MRHSKHIWRAVLILIAFLLAFIAGRHFMVPETFGMAGHYRYQALEETMARTPKHGGRDSCKKCHEEQYALATAGKHAPLNCEVCHAPVADHARTGKDAPKEPKEAYLAAMPTNPTYRTCAYCHEQQAARPKTFKQVSFRKHLEEQGLPAGARMPEKICLKCHSPHDPSGTAEKK